jgi:hypothetical protein
MHSSFPPPEMESESKKSIKQNGQVLQSLGANLAIIAYTTTTLLVVDVEHIQMLSFGWKTHTGCFVLFYVIFYGVVVVPNSRSQVLLL